MYLYVIFIFNLQFNENNSPKYISPKDPLPILRPSRYLFPTRNSILVELMRNKIKCYTCPVYEFNTDGAIEKIIHCQFSNNSDGLHRKIKTHIILYFIFSTITLQPNTAYSVNKLINKPTPSYSQNTAWPNNKTDTQLAIWEWEDES